MTSDNPADVIEKILSSYLDGSLPQVLTVHRGQIDEDGVQYERDNEAGIRESRGQTVAAEAPAN